MRQLSELGEKLTFNEVYYSINGGQSNVPENSMFSVTLEELHLTWQMSKFL